MEIIKRKTVIQTKCSKCPKCGSDRVMVCRIPGKVPQNKMKKEFFYARLIKCTNRKCNAIWMDPTSIVKKSQYSDWLKSPTGSLFET